MQKLDRLWPLNNEICDIFLIFCAIYGKFVENKITEEISRKIDYVTSTFN